MSKQNKSGASDEITIRFNLGTFEGFNFQTQGAICRILTASDVINWDHDREGEAEFWPAGDRPEVSLLFRPRREVTSSELRDLVRLLDEVGDDAPETFLRIYYTLNVCGTPLADLDRDKLDNPILHLYFGTSFLDLRNEAAFDLFESYYPEEYRVWEKSTCDGLMFDPDHFLDSPVWWTEEFILGETVALLVASH
ncbi:MAG: hypothetical protein RLZZ188_1031 [Verrucomicrobiota bacterium]